MSKTARLSYEGPVSNLFVSYRSLDSALVDAGWEASGTVTVGGCGWLTPDSNGPLAHFGRGDLGVRAT